MTRAAPCPCRRVPCSGPQWPPPQAEADGGHPGAEGGVDTSGAVLDYNTAIGSRCELLGGVKEKIGSRLTALDHRRAEEVFAKVMPEAGQLKLSPALFHGAARRDTNGQSERFERLRNSVDRFSD